MFSLSPPASQKNSGEKTDLPNLDPPGNYVDPFRFEFGDGEELFAGTNYPPPFRMALKRKAHSGPMGARLRTKTLAPTAKRAVGRYVKTCMKREAEHKHVETTDGITTAAAGTVGLSVVSLSQGTANLGRVGTQVQAMSFNTWGFCALPAASTGDTVRFIFYCDHMPSQSAPAVTDILAAANFLSPYNLDKVGGQGNGPGRFSIIRDFTKSLVPTSAVVVAGTGVVQTHYEMHFRCDTPIHYTGNTGTVNDLVKNNYGWIYISASGVATVNARTQFCYIDV